MGKETAVEWLSIMLRDSSKELFDGNIWEQAKAMEKEQHNETWEKGRLEDKGDNYLGKQLSFEQYYNETYKKSN